MNKDARILVIDDEAGLRDLLSHEFALQGYQVDTAMDGCQALEKLAQQTFQLVLCDINMPKMGGLEILEHIRKLDSDMEVIMMTGYATIEDAVMAMKKGAYDFVQKPFNLEELFQLAEKSLEKGDLRRTILELRETKKKLEATQMQLIQSEKLAGIGQLAAGVAHELNNPLSGVMGFAQLLLEDAGLTAQQRKDIETIYAQSQRCRTIIQNLLQFSRRKDPLQEVLDLAPLLLATLDLVKYDFSTSAIDLSQTVPPTLPLILGDASQLQQVFLNLLTNARQAMAGGKKGRLVIEAGQRGNKVFVRCADNGHGIPKDIQDKIFDPFFTTKPVGQGTGLGLSICYGIVQQHRGALYVESKVDAGSTFTVELPIYERL
ncbi:MAG: hypothetical protein A2992_07080 [Elusimicrobia bacterium RIFCSPLOWO2_01_FULL_59_12]|nr:MAG: hypothetical protein A2992_07080 [Elusimicrobia bacterium RIFCSPLOWO2_01_FULL_59_12]